MTAEEFNKHLDELTDGTGFDLDKVQKSFAFSAAKKFAKENHLELLKEITRLQEKYDEDGFDCKPIIKLQRLEQIIDFNINKR